MIFCIITHVNHYQEQKKYFAYAPYVREMNIWLQYADTVIVVAPLEKKEKTAIDIAYEKELQFYKVPAFSFTSFKQLLKAIYSLPFLLYVIFKAMRKADHIHLRCPGNMGLLGCLVQIAFPKKKKTAKYAGNWDLKAKQPWSYRLQKWILNNTFLTKNMQVLVYGEWEGSSKNIKPFFTATYSEVDKKQEIIKKELPGLNFDGTLVKLLFVGTLSEGKRPLYAIQLVEKLHQKGYPVRLELFGEGNERHTLESYVKAQELQKIVFFKGNQSKEMIHKAYLESHFLVLPSKSEGWPKVVAEAMFWNCLPVATPVSCVPMMLEHGNRGVLLTMLLNTDVQQLERLIGTPLEYQQKIEKALSWSREFTVEKFDAEIQKLFLQ